jgi:hypothetical protein
MTTLFTVLLELARSLGEIVEGTATSASATTIVDTALASLSYPDDFFNNGTCFIRSGTHTDKTRVISDYAKSTGTATIATLTTTPGTPEYSLAGSKFPRDMMVRAINLALSDMGFILGVDTSLVTVAEQGQYDLPSGVSGVLQVEYETDTDVFETLTRWMEVAGHLNFQDVMSVSGDTLRLTYKKKHASVSLDADSIDNLIPLNRLRATAAMYCLEAYFGKVVTEAPKFYQQQYERYRQEAERLRTIEPIRLPARPVILGK